MKGRRTIFIVLVALGLSASAIGSESDSFVVEFQFNIVQGEGCSTLMVEDTMLQEIPGEPLIPYYSARILLPQDTEVKEVKVKHTDPIVEKGIDMVWGQLPYTSSDAPVKVTRNEEIYGSDKEYPNELYRIVSTESFRGFRILNLILYPLQYQPKSQTVKFYSELYVHVQVKEGPGNELYRGLKCDKEAVKSMVNNPEMTETYGESKVVKPLSETYEYIIITNDTLESSFQLLADHKAFFVNGANIYTVSWIYSNYTGDDNQEKIRNFITDMYTNHSTKYVLLGGDVSVVPYRGFYASITGYPQYTNPDIAADMYYAHLDGTFNSDGDSYWAEPNDGVDWLAEVAVGRAPVETVSEAENFVTKVLNHETLVKSKVCQFHQARITPTCENIPDSRCLAWNCDDWVPPDYQKRYLFEEDQTVTKELWIDAWGGSNCTVAPLVIQHMGDTPTYDPDCDPTCYEINCSPQVTWCCSDMPDLVNSCLPWHTTPASCVGHFPYDDCLAECYVQDPGGAIACFANDSYAWYSTANACMYSGEFVEKQFRALFSDGKEKFGELLNQSKSYMISQAASNSVYRWCFYEINLIGDPEIPCLTRRACVDITNPEDGSEVSGTVDITASACSYITYVQFYIDTDKDGIDDDDFFCEDTEPPFGCSWDTTTSLEGEELIISAYCFAPGFYQGYDTITVTVNNFHITSPAERSKACIGNTVNITTSTAVTIDTVKFYLIWTANDNINGVLLCTDTEAPFACNWNTTGYVSRWYTIRVEAYTSGELKNVDQILIKLMAC